MPRRRTTSARRAAPIAIGEVGGALAGIGPRARLDAAGRGDRARRLRRRAASRGRGRQPVHPPRRRLRDRDRGRRGQRRSFDVVGVAGVRPLQQYLLAPEPGRTQAFDIAWDTERQRLVRPLSRRGAAGRATGCTGPGPTRAGRRAAPSATPPASAATTTRRRGATRPSMAEIGVGCEACHGPGEAHAAWAEAPDGYDAGALAGADGAGADRGSRRLGGGARSSSAPAAIRGARRFVDGNPLPGTPYHDSYALALLRDGLYRAGRADRGGGLRVRLVPAGEDVRARGALQRLPRAACGRRCAPRATRSAPSAIRRPATTGSRRCGRRSTTTRRITSMRPGSEGAACRAATCRGGSTWGWTGGATMGSGCRGRTWRRATGAPDVCTDCHTDRDPAWAAAELARRFPESAHRGPSFATAFAAARWDPAARAGELAGDRGGAEDRPGSCGRRRSTCWRRWPIRRSRTRTAPLLGRSRPAGARGGGRGAAGAAAGGAGGAAGAGAEGPAAGGADRGGQGDAGGRPGRRAGGGGRGAGRCDRRVAGGAAERGRTFPRRTCRSAARRSGVRNLELAEAAFREAVGARSAAGGRLGDDRAHPRRGRRCRGRARGARRGARGQSRPAGACRSSGGSSGRDVKGLRGKRDMERVWNRFMETVWHLKQSGLKG